jgi:hypothetical protein
MKRVWLALVGLVAACDHGGPVREAIDASSEDRLDAMEAAFVERRDVAPIDTGDVTLVDAGPEMGDEGASGGEAGDGAADACANEGVPPSTLECTGLYANFDSKEVAPNAFAYTPSAPLWSDGAEKQRWIELPSHTQIDISNPSEWVFPVGTKLFKEFRVNGKRVETRLFQKVKSTFWKYATYAWNRDDSAAPINFGGPVPVGDGGDTWNIPTNDDCAECHRGRQDRILGFEQVSLGLPFAQGLTLAQLVEKGLVTPAPPSVSLTIGDDGTGLSSLALAWIHVNCGVTCHNSNPSSAGVGSGMLLRLDPAQLDGSRPDTNTWDVLRTTVYIPAVSGSVTGQPRILPHDAARSVIYRLISRRGELQMPPIASLKVDSTDDAVVEAWIQALAVGAPFPDGGGPLYDAGVTDALTLDDSAPDSTPGSDTGVIFDGAFDTGITFGDAGSDAEFDTGMTFGDAGSE